MAGTTGMAAGAAKVYAEALFELCCEEDRLKECCDDLGQVKTLIWDTDGEDNEEFVRFLSSPLVPGEDKARAVENIFGGKIDPLALDFLCLTAEKGRAGLLPEMYGELRRLYNEKMGIIEVTAVTSEPMSDRLMEKLKTKLAQKTGKTVVLTNTVDKSIIGGIVLRYGNNELDGSVRTRLDELKARIGSVIA